MKKASETIDSLNEGLAYLEQQLLKENRCSVQCLNSNSAYCT